MADIAINPVTRRVQFTGNTGTGPFAFTFNILADEDIAVYKNTTLLTLTTHYTVTTNANGTGSITLDSGQALISSDVLTIIGGRDLSRTTDFVTAGDLLASSLNEQLDSLVIMTQQLDEKVGRTIKTNPGDVYTDLELPTKDNRKGTVLGFNATSGDPEVGPTIADVSSLASITADIATLADIEDGTDATDAIQTVAGISSNVSTVAGISSNVTTVAGNTSNINAVAADATDIGTVAGSISNVNTVAGIDSNITTVAGNTTNINTVAGNNSNITTVAGVSANVTTVAGISSDVTTVAGISSDVTTVAADGTDIGTVAASIADVNTVASNIATISAKVSKSGDTMTGDLTIQGNLTVSGTTITVDSASAQAIDLGDGDRMRFGDSNDAYIEWNGTYFDARSTGRFDLLSSGNDLRLSTGTNVGLIVNHTGGTPAVQLYNSGVQRLATTSTGIDVTGTVTADGLTVDSSSFVAATFERTTVGGGSALQLTNGDDNAWQIISGGDETYALNYIPNGGSTRPYFKASSGGDISFYEDTGTTAKFFWDASAESLGIGTSSPATLLDVSKSSGWSPIVTRSSTLFAGISSDSNYGNDVIFSSGSALRFSTMSDTSGTGYAERMRIDSSGNVGIGNTNPSDYNASADNLVVGTTSGDNGITISSGTTSQGSLFFADGTASGTEEANGYLIYVHGSNYMAMGTGNNERMRIDSSGNVGIGTSSPSYKLDLTSSSDGYARQWISSQSFVSSADNSAGFQIRNLGAGTTGVKFSNYANNAEWMRIDSSGNVGIGTSSPGGDLHVYDPSADCNLVIQSGTGNSQVGFGDNANNFTGKITYNHTSDYMMFQVNQAERMRIDSSGNLLVGTTDTALWNNNAGSSADFGFAVIDDGWIDAASYNQTTMYLNRTGSDGNILNVRKNGSSVGSLGVNGAGLYVGSEYGSDAFLWFGNNVIKAANSTGGGRDNAISLGDQYTRFTDLYLSGGVYFGGTGAANKLDDYEEGTWTPTAIGDTGSATLSDASGKYVKIGSLVHITCEVDVSNVNTATGNVYIGGLPFTVANILSPTSIEASVAVGYWTGFSTAINSLSAAATAGQTYCALYGLTSSTATGKTTITWSDFGAGEIRLTLTYRA